MITLEELKRELRDRKAELRKYEAELEQRIRAFEKQRDNLARVFKKKYDADVYSCLYEPEDELYDNYVLTCHAIKLAMQLNK